MDWSKDEEGYFTNTIFFIFKKELKFIGLMLLFSIHGIPLEVVDPILGPTYM